MSLSTLMEAHHETANVMGFIFLIQNEVSTTAMDCNKASGRIIINGVNVMQIPLVGAVSKAVVTSESIRV